MGGPGVPGVVGLFGHVAEETYGIDLLRQRRKSLGGDGVAVVLRMLPVHCGGGC